MKPKQAKNSILFLFILFAFSHCELIPIGSPMPISAELAGRWAWIKTVTPTRIYNPETEGYEEDISFGSTSQFGYMAIYKNDSLKENYVQNRSKGASVNNKESSIINYYRPSGLIKVYLKFDEQSFVNHIETTPLLQEYSSKADTVRHYYERRSYEPRPFE